MPTAERVLAAAEDLFGARGYHGTHMRELAALAGIQKASLFHHFSSKEELYRAVLRRCAGEIEEALKCSSAGGAPFRERLRRLIAAYVNLVAERPARTRILLRELLETVAAGNAAIPREFQRVFSMVEGLVREGQRAGAFHAVDPAPLILGMVGIAAFFVGAVPAIAPRWAPQGMGRSEMIPAMTQSLIEIVERMLVDAAPAAGD